MGEERTMTAAEAARSWTRLWTPTRYARNGSVEIAYDTLAGSEGEREADSGPRDTRAQSRQVGAAWHGPKLRELHKPVLVLHGGQDPLLRVSAARATARAIAGARLVILPGVGHDLPAPAWPAVADEVRQLAGRARAAEAGSVRPG
jgi:pimeloyl-ACP methyl ester carboxylesterase